MQRPQVVNRRKRKGERRKRRKWRREELRKRWSTALIWTTHLDHPPWWNVSWCKNSIRTVHYLLFTSPFFVRSFPRTTCISCFSFSIFSLLFFIFSSALTYLTSSCRTFVSDLEDSWLVSIFFSLYIRSLSSAAGRYIYFTFFFLYFSLLFSSSSSSAAAGVREGRLRMRIKLSFSGVVGGGGRSQIQIENEV